MRSLPATDGKPLKSTALDKVKTVAFAPMPSASIPIAVNANPGACRSERNAKRTSAMMPSKLWIRPATPRTLSVQPQHVSLTCAGALLRTRVAAVRALVRRPDDLPKLVGRPDDLSALLQTLQRA
jgi:hypothetical protein